MPKFAKIAVTVIAASTAAFVIYSEKMMRKDEQEHAARMADHEAFMKRVNNFLAN